MTSPAGPANVANDKRYLGREAVVALASPLIGMLREPKGRLGMPTWA